MKKILLLLIALFVSQTIFATNPLDSILHQQTKRIKKIVKHNNFYIPAGIKKSELSDDYFYRQSPVDSAVTSQLALAKQVFDSLEVTRKFIDIINPNSLIEFPVGIKKQVGNITYTMGIISAKISPQFTELTAFVKIALPQMNGQGNQKVLFFGANNIKLSHEGGIYEDANLVLLGDLPISLNSNNTSFLVLKGGLDMRTGDVNNKTYVTVDCNGFKELKITADVIFSRSLLEPVNPTNYEVVSDSTKQVVGHFTTVASDWNDILVNIDLPPFQITKEGSTTGKGGLIFKLSNAVFDFSDLRNDSSLHFPADYDQYLVPGNHDLWRGVYIKALDVILPKEFAKRDSLSRVSFHAGEILLDNMGVTGNISVNHILPLNEGSASKWQMSVDKFEVSLLANQLTRAGFNGKIVLPVTKKPTTSEINDSIAIKKKSLIYSALLDLNTDTYTLNVSPVDTLAFDVFRAKATIFPSSSVELKVINHTFRPKAMLNGKLSIKTGIDSTAQDKNTINLEDITFEHLQLQTVSPKLSIGSLGYTGDVKLAGLPITISHIAATANDTKASLNFNLSVNMMSGGFVANTSLSIKANHVEIDGIKRWKYERVHLSDITLHADFSNMKLDGLLQIKEDDPTYGDGYYGAIMAEFNDINVSASAWFGKTTFRYWYVDAFADLRSINPHIKIGPIDVIGFGGGAYYRMKKTTGTSTATPTGLDYQPDANSGLGFRAMLGYAFQNEKAVNGRLAFEMAFNSSGGLNKILFYGSAHIMQTPDGFDAAKFKGKTKSVATSTQTTNNSDIVSNSKNKFPHESGSFDTGINAYLGMEMDFANHSFHAMLETYINTPTLKGGNANHLAGTAILHIDPTTWYLHVGTPSQRIALDFGIGVMSATANTYLMIGDGISDVPPPPSNVQNILHLSDSDFASRDTNLLNTGRGFALGMSVAVDTGDLTFLIFYARFAAGVGFDIMIKDFGDTACAGSGQIGIDGWYASGQAYAYLQGKIGIKIKLFGVTKKVNILSGSAAVLLQAKLPNPSWFRGYVGGDYDVLGIVKGHYHFKVEFGHQCDVVGGNPLGGLKIISQITPAENAEEIDVFTTPQASFNVKVNEQFTLEDDNGVNHIYRVQLDEFSIKRQGNPIPGHLEWVTNDVVNFVSTEVLPENDSISVKVKVIFQEKNGNTWQTIMQDGQPAEEIETLSFKTGPAPNYIPLNNVAYCYPVVNQKYFYKDERNTGYIKLKQGQSYLFSPQTDWVQKLKITGASGEQVMNQVSYDTISRLVSFTLPQLQNQQLYNFKITSISPAQATADNQAQYDTQSLVSGNTVEIKNMQAQDVVQGEVETEIIAFDFNTSQYGTFAEKINAKNLTNVNSWLYNPTVTFLSANTTDSEAFSEVELVGGEYTDNMPLVKVEAILDDDYYQNVVYPLVYEGYPLRSDFTFNRDSTFLGLPPIKAIYVSSSYINYLQTNPSHYVIRKSIPFIYKISKIYYDDFVDLRYKVTNAFSSGTTNQRYNTIINSTFPNMSYGNYKMKLIYVTPGNMLSNSTIYNILYNN